MTGGRHQEFHTEKMSVRREQEIATSRESSVTANPGNPPLPDGVS